MERPRTVSQPSPASAIGWAPRLVLLAVLALFVWVGTLQLATPTPLPATAPEAVFSAERAMEHLRVIAAEPRPAGSEAHAKVRQYLVDELTAMGLETQVQTSSASIRFAGEDYFRVGAVQNVVARLPGTASTGAIALNAHYDGGSTGPAAGDNGAAVAVVLETLRALRAGPPLANDVIAVFTDAEEEGDLGAIAFTQENTWVGPVRLAINYEAQGSGGPVLLYYTSPDDGWLVEQYLAVAPDAQANSMMVALSELLKSQRPATDLHEYMDVNIPGIAFVFVGDTPAYHTIRDNVDQIDHGTIQQEGGYTLGLARHFGNVDLAALPASSPDRVAFNVLPGVTADYSTTLALPIAAAITLLLAALLAIGLRRRLLTAGGVIVATLAFLLAVVISVAVAEGLWAAIWSLDARLSGGAGRQLPDDALRGRSLRRQPGRDGGRLGAAAGPGASVEPDCRWATGVGAAALGHERGLAGRQLPRRLVPALRHVAAGGDGPASACPATAVGSGSGAIAGGAPGCGVAAGDGILGAGLGEPVRHRRAAGAGHHHALRRSRWGATGGPPRVPCRRCLVRDAPLGFARRRSGSGARPGGLGHGHRRLRRRPPASGPPRLRAECRRRNGHVGEPGPSTWTAGRPASSLAAPSAGPTSPSPASRRLPIPPPRPRSRYRRPPPCS